MKFSLKIKILLGIAILLIVSITFNLSYSYKLFVEDKTSYIYESGLRRAESLSDQYNSRIQDIINRTNFLSSFIDTSTSNLEKYVNSQDDLIMTGVINTQDNIIYKVFTNSRFTNKLSTLHSLDLDIFKKEIMAHEKSTGKTWTFAPKDELKTIIHLSKGFYPNQLIFTITDLTNFYSVLKSDKKNTNKIFTKGLSQKNSENEWIAGLDFNKSKKGVFDKKIDGVEMLIAYTYATPDTLILSGINKTDAFGITRFLILKTIIFAVFLLGISFALGIYFSSSITLPIKKLTAAAQDIAKNNFETVVEIQTTDEIKLLGDTFNFMNGEIRGLLKNKEELIFKLEEYSKNLEIMVENRTIELKKANDFMALMVNSLDQGLVVFDNELKCHPMFTNACEPLFGISPLNKTLPQILKLEKEEEVQSLHQWANITFNELIPFESAVDLGVRTKVTGNSFSDDNFKHVQLDYYPMRDDENKIANIVLIATDKTNEILATETAKKQANHVAMILKILNNKMQFESFIGEVDEILERFETAYSDEQINFELCMMLFHTLNGGFGIYNINSLQMLSREYENEIVNIKEINPPPEEYAPFIKMHVQNIKEEFLNFRIELDKLIGTNFSSNQTVVEIPNDKIQSFKNALLKIENNEIFQQYVEDFIKVPIYNYFKAYDDLCRMTAIKIGKEFNGLIVQNPHLKVNAAPLLEFFNVLVHLFRNCLDHGIEDTYTREQLGKSRDGKISITFDELNDLDKRQKQLLIVIEDDGAGISHERVRQKLMQLHPENDYSTISDNEIIYSIFDPFFSTRDEVSALSGRGVGMSAIKEVVDRLEGKITIETQTGKGTIFTFMIPIESTLI